MIDRLKAVRWSQLYSDDVIVSYSDDEKVVAGCCLPCSAVGCVLFLLVYGAYMLVVMMKEFGAALYRVCTGQARHTIVVQDEQDVENITTRPQ